VSHLDDLASRPWEFDFHAAMRRIECDHPELPRWGEARHPSEEPARLGQDPSLGFASAPIARYRRRSDDRSDQLRVAFLGMFGSQGALPLHLTEHAHQRLRGVGDRTFGAFVDVLQHRMLVLFHKAWAMAQPTVAQDRAGESAFLRYVGSLCGRGSDRSRDRDSLPDHAKLQFVGRLAPRSRNAEGLEAMVAGYFSVPARLEPFVGEWLETHEDDRWRLGCRRKTRLGEGTIVGSRRFERGHKFRLHLGPLGRSDFESFLPGSERLTALSDLVRSYVGDELSWDVELRLAEGEATQTRLGRGARLGYDTWLGKPAHAAALDRRLRIAPGEPRSN
jgi:type VI secretion system protein ImpH